MTDSKVYKLSINRFNKRLSFWISNYITKKLSMIPEIIINTNSD